PITARTREALLRRIVAKALPPVRWHNRAVPQDLESIVHKATAKDPDERYATAAEFAGDLQKFLEGKPVTATPYRYRFDQREIAATRPPEIMIAAVLAFIFAFYAGLSEISAINFLWADRLTLAQSIFAIVCNLLLLLSLFFSGVGLLAGRAWARGLGIAGGAVLASLQIGYVWELARDPSLWRFFGTPMSILLAGA